MNGRGIKPDSLNNDVYIHDSQKKKMQSKCLPADRRKQRMCMYNKGILFTLKRE